MWSIDDIYLGNGVSEAVVMSYRSFWITAIARSWSAYARLSLSGQPRSALAGKYRSLYLWWSCKWYLILTISDQKLLPTLRQSFLSIEQQLEALYPKGNSYWRYWDCSSKRFDHLCWTKSTTAWVMDGHVSYACGDLAPDVFCVSIEWSVKIITVSQVFV